MSTDISLRSLACAAQHGAHYFPPPNGWHCKWCGRVLGDVNDNTLEPFVSDETAKRYVRYPKTGKIHHFYTKSIGTLPKWMRP